MREHARGLLPITGGKLVLVAANAGLMLLLARRLDLASYGLLVTIISAQLLVSRAILMGLDSGVIRLGSEYPEARAAGLRAIRFGIAAALLLGALAAPLLARGHWPLWATPVVVAGAAGTALVDFGYAGRLAQGRLRAAALVQPSAALLRFLLTAPAAFLWPALVYLAFPAASLIAGSLATSRWSAASAARDTILRLVRYSFWHALAMSCVILGQHLGNFVLTARGVPEQAGLFGLGLTFSLGFGSVYTALSDYLMAKTSRREDGLRSLMKSSLRLTALAGALCVPAVFAVAFALARVLKPDYQPGIGVFLILAAGKILLIVCVPLEIACHQLKRPDLVFKGWALRAAAIAAAAIIMRVSDAHAMAWAQLGGNLAAQLGFLAIFLGAVRRRSQAAPAYPAISSQVTILRS